MENRKLVMFDLDGTLFRTELVDIEAANRALVKNGLPTKSDEEVLDLIGEPMDIFMKMLAPFEGEDVLEKLKHDMLSFEIELIYKYGELYPGTADVLNDLKGSNITLCICSNGSQRYVDTICEKFGFASIFDDIVFKKPLIDKIKAVQLIKEKYESDISIFVGDRDMDFIAGRENGCITIAAAYGFGRKEEFSLADYTAHSMAEVGRIVKSL